ncbi:MAG: TIGR04076 family protein [Candidatus Thorarchaeota archaeon]|nr:MAG: TIGR04076 family protein [Candidatus Thorarchaeota archaeon]
MKTNLKLTVVKKFSPEDILGQEVKRHTGERIPPCRFEEGQEFIVDNHLTPPDDFCGQAWQDLYTILMIYYCGGDCEWPEPGVTYSPCGDGLRPVIFKIEKMTD